MNHSKTHFLAANIALLAILGLTATAPRSHTSHGYDGKDYFSVWSANLVSNTALVTMDVVEEIPDTMEYRIAKRLQRRVRKMRGASPSIHNLATALQKRQKLLKKNIVVQIATDENPDYGQWHVSISQHPLWILPKISFTDAAFEISPARVRSYLKERSINGIEYPQNTTLLSVTGSLLSDTTMSRATTRGIAKSGYTFDSPKAAATIARTLESTQTGVVISLLETNGIIKNETGLELGELKLLASGKSDFTGSSYNRRANVEKAIQEHVNNIIVPPGETFSFNSTLDGPVTIGNGWHMAKVIFNGDELRPSPGGGICQASTTTYRAVINAGFPVVDRRSHSLYVYYYEEHGVGIDATIYPGQQDLAFLNDTDNHILIQAYNDGFEAHVNIYGTPDDRKVVVKGPYFKGNAPEDFRYNDRKLLKNEIAWVQEVEYKNGDTRTNTIYSKYKYIPSSIQAKYGQQEPELVATIID